MDRNNVRMLVFCLTMMAFFIVEPAKAAPEGIGWIPTWKQGIAEARRTNKPILLLSAAPACGGVSGLW